VAGLPSETDLIPTSGHNKPGRQGIASTVLIRLIMTYALTASCLEVGAGGTVGVPSNVGTTDPQGLLHFHPEMDILGGIVSSPIYFSKEAEPS